MLDLRREFIQTIRELRANPRIEFHLPVTMIGIDAKASLIDFSLGGFYIETDATVTPRIGQRLNIALKLPSEHSGITVKAEVVYRAKGGFGCKLCDHPPETRRALERCFNIFSETLPVVVSAYEGHPISAAA